MSSAIACESAIVQHNAGADFESLTCKYLLAVSNPCDEMNCTYMCLITSMNPTLSACACPTGFDFDSSQMECIGENLYEYL